MTASAKHSIPIVLFLAAGLLAGGCAHGRGRRGDRRDRMEDGRHGSSDLLAVARTLTRSLLQTPAIEQGNRPVVTLQEIDDETQAHVNTRAVTEAVRRELQRSARIRFAGDLKAEQEDLDRAAAAGEAAVGWYRVEGSVTPDTRSSGGASYRLVLLLRNSRTTHVDWSSDEHESRVGLLGGEGRQPHGSGRRRGGSRRDGER